jgi:hypothetical protein
VRFTWLPCWQPQRSPCLRSPTPGSRAPRPAAPPPRSPRSC